MSRASNGRRRPNKALLSSGVLGVLGNASVKSALAAAVISPPFVAFAGTTQTPVGKEWPLCFGWKYNFEAWQIIHPDELTPEQAEQALKWVADNRGKDLQGEARMILSAHLQTLRGYELRVRAEQGVIRNSQNPVKDFCTWITNNTMPE